MQSYEPSRNALTLLVFYNGKSCIKTVCHFLPPALPFTEKGTPLFLPEIFSKPCFTEFLCHSVSGPATRSAELVPDIPCQFHHQDTKYNSHHHAKKHIRWKVHKQIQTAECNQCCCDICKCSHLSMHHKKNCCSCKCPGRMRGWKGRTGRSATSSAKAWSI